MLEIETKARFFEPVINRKKKALLYAPVTLGLQRSNRRLDQERMQRRRGAKRKEDIGILLGSTDNDTLLADSLHPPVA